LVEFVLLHPESPILRTYLIGFMGSGKTSLGKHLSRLLGATFIDLDDVFEERYHIRIYDFFDKYGEENFRKIEKELLIETAGSDNLVVSTGGGTPCFFDNMEFIKDNGVSIYLRMTSRELASRLKSVKKKRPLLKQLSPEMLEEWISAQLLNREPFYLRANYIFHPFTEDIRDLALKLK
jgi:shikimate kinase